MRNVARGLKVFAAQRAFGYIDRLANAFSVESLRQILYEFLRDLGVEESQARVVKRDDREVKVVEVSKESGKKELVELFMPSARDIETLLSLAEKDISIAKVVASLALTYRG